MINQHRQINFDVIYLFYALDYVKFQTLTLYNLYCINILFNIASEIQKSYCFVGVPYRMVTAWIKGVGYFTHQGFGNIKFGVTFLNKQVNPSGRRTPDNPI